MPTLAFPLPAMEQAARDQLLYSVAFVGESVLDRWIDEETGELRVEVGDADGAGEELRRQVETLIERYSLGGGELSTEVLFEHRPDVGVVDAWDELLERRWVTPVGDGHVVLRGLAARLMGAVDRVALRDFAEPLGAEPEVFPSTILGSTLHRANHLTSFPEHLDFVAHLRRDLDAIEGFSEACREDGWSAEATRGRLADPGFVVSPSCCFHCYEAMEGWSLDPPGRVVTALLGCHRYEAGNQRTMTRLRAFTMREVICVGHPGWVIEQRARLDDAIVELARRWELHCTFETANDLFFTEEFGVKAPFQRRRAAKKELRALIPQDDASVSVMSSNFHATSFGKAFRIDVAGRPAASACVGWGLERFVYAIFSQHGLDPAAWPPGLREDLGSDAGEAAG